MLPSHSCLPGALPRGTDHPLTRSADGPLAQPPHLLWAGRALFTLWVAGLASIYPVVAAADLSLSFPARPVVMVVGAVGLVACAVASLRLDRMPAGCLDVLLFVTSAAAGLAGLLPGHHDVLLMCSLWVVPFGFALLPPRRALAQAVFVVVINGGATLLMMRPNNTDDVPQDLLTRWLLLVLTVTALALVMRRLADHLYRRSQVAEAVAELGGRALSTAEPDDLLREALRVAMRIIGSDYGTALRRMPDGAVRVAAEIGPLPLPAGTELPLAAERSYALHVMESSVPFISPDLGNDPRVSPPMPLLLRGITSSLAVPVSGSRGVMGVLALHTRDRRRFTSYEVSAAMALAHVVASAWRQAEHQKDEARLAMYQDRERIALDLHDLVIQRLFASGLALQTLRKFVPEGRPAERLEHIGDDLDATIADIRSTIFALQGGSETGEETSLSVDILATSASASATLGFEPIVKLRGPVDHPAVREVATDLLPVLAEALSNVARHAEATSVTVEVVADAASVSLIVGDNGRGMTDTPRRSGLSNMSIRAERLGGQCEIRSERGAGTKVTWVVPLEGSLARLRAAAV